MLSKEADRIANIEDPDQTAQSDFGLHLLLLKACFTFILQPFVHAFLAGVTERRDREADRRQFHTESQNVRQLYDVRTIISLHIQRSRKTFMQNLQDFRKTKR